MKRLFWGMLEVEVEFKEDEHMEEHEFLGCWRSRWSSRRNEKEEQVI